MCNEINKRVANNLYFLQVVNKKRIFVLDNIDFYAKSSYNFVEKEVEYLDEYK